MKAGGVAAQAVSARHRCQPVPSRCRTLGVELLAASWPDVGVVVWLDAGAGEKVYCLQVLAVAAAMPDSGDFQIPRWDEHRPEADMGSAQSLALALARFGAI